MISHFHCHYQRVDVPLVFILISISYKYCIAEASMSTKIGIDQSHGFMQEIINNQFDRKSYQLEVEDLKV